MGTIWGKELTRGLDVRRLPEATPPGSLIKGQDGHITRGGEFEKRAAFVPTYTLPAGTVGLAATSASIVVFGTGFPSTPSGVLHQHMDNSTFGGSTALVRVWAWDLFDDKLYVAVEFENGNRGHYYDGTRVSRDGLAARTAVNIISGAPGDTFDIKIDGVSTAGGPIAWNASTSGTAAAINTAINSAVTSPDYVSNRVINALLIDAAVVGTAANGRVVSVVTTGTGVATIPAPSNPMNGGFAALNNNTKYVRTIGTKEYTLTESLLQFSAVGAPTAWDTGIGYGFIDTSSYTSGSEDLTAVVEFRDGAAVFSQRAIQIWKLAADPAANVFRKSLRNTGTSCPKSIAQFGDNDVFYLDENGLRSLRARDASAAASTYGIGVRVDPLIVAKLRSLTETERTNVIGLIEPVTGNFWLIMKDTIFVYASFPEEGINGWTTYSTHRFTGSTRVDFNVDDAVVFNRRVYLRSGDRILVYGGLTTGQTTDATVAEAWTAYHDADDPTSEKSWESLDAAVSGAWAVSIGTSLRDTTAEELVADPVDATTYSTERIGLTGRSTHISLRFRSQGTGAAKVGAYAVRYS